jgi:hypothetical protein
MTAIETLFHTESQQHDAILLRILSDPTLTDKTELSRAALFEVVGNLEGAAPQLVLRFLDTCPWPERSMGRAWRKIVDSLARNAPADLKVWVLDRIAADALLDRRIAVALSVLLQTTGTGLTPEEGRTIFRKALASGQDARFVFAEAAGPILDRNPALGEEIFAVLTTKAQHDVGTALARSLAHCLPQNPAAVLSQVPRIVTAAQQFRDEGVAISLIQVLRGFPRDHARGILPVLEKAFPRQLFEQFLSEKFCVEFLDLLKLFCEEEPSVVYGLAKRVPVSTPGTAGAMAAVCTNVAKHTTNKERLEELLWDLLGHAKIYQNNVKNAVQFGLRILDEKLGERKVPMAVLSFYSSISDDSALYVLLEAATRLASWTTRDTEEVLSGGHPLPSDVRTLLLLKAAGSA